jgi:hypothetical protein
MGPGFWATRPTRAALFPSLNDRMLCAQNNRRPMTKSFKLGDHVEWNSEAGRVRGVIVKKVVSDVRFKGYAHHASKGEPQYIIKSEKTDHIAIHKGRALKHVRARIQRDRLKRTKGS